MSLSFLFIVVLFLTDFQQSKQLDCCSELQVRDWQPDKLSHWSQFSLFQEAAVCFALLNRFLVSRHLVLYILLWLVPTNKDYKSFCCSPTGIASSTWWRSGSGTTCTQTGVLAETMAAGYETCLMMLTWQPICTFPVSSFLSSSQ